LVFNDVVVLGVEPHPHNIRQIMVMQEICLLSLANESLNTIFLSVTIVG